MTKNKYTDEELLENLREKGESVVANDLRNCDGPSITTYQRRFGSFNDARELAGLSRKPQSPKPDNGIRGKQYYHHILETASCIKCGEDSSAVIEFHHPRDDKEATVSQIAGNNHSSQTVYDELKKTVPVCANCHAKHHSSMSPLRITDEVEYSYPHPKDVTAMHAANQQDRA